MDIKMAMKEKSKVKMTPDKAVGTGNTRLKFQEKVDISPESEAKKANPKMETGMFGEDALGSEIPATGEYAAKSKKEYFDSKVFNHKMPNTILPTANY